ncbi:MAG: ATP-dependent sacrificial sulfur transferase LarE [Deltaproteobacteria bacterium]|nr:MAG: ATP-dependent sacrificial sulfur transferase LarE [Deltaproteobacteria bacterium]
MDEHLDRLKNILRDLGSVLVAFSGGVDSSFLLHLAHEVLGERAKAITFVSPFVSRQELQRASRFCEERGIRHILLEMDPLASEAIRANQPDRCYHCKKQVFSQGLVEAHKMSIPYLVEGTQLSDASDHRPGHRALVELGIKSPLSEAGLSKNQVRILSKKLGLSSWNLPPMACLASRIPYGTVLDLKSLARVESAEGFLFDQGFNLVRVREHQGTARIELSPEEIARLSDMGLRDRLVAHFKSLGYVAVTLDLEGYRTGRLGELWEQETGEKLIK